MGVKEIRTELRALADAKRAADLRWYFKTGPGEYGEGDVFIGIRVPALRNLAKKHQDLPLADTTQLLKSGIHEERLLSLFILIRQFDKGDKSLRREIYKLYLANTRHINNWDLVDSSAPYIVGPHLIDKSRKPLYRLAKSRSLWERRIAIMAASHYVRRNDFADTLAIADILLKDPEALIHKAVGWMLREVGKRSMMAEEAFLRERCRVMPRTMLRYAIEKFPEPKRQRYLKIRSTQI